jgi:hypothetical protein
MLALDQRATTIPLAANTGGDPSKWVEMGTDTTENGHREGEFFLFPSFGSSFGVYPQQAALSFPFQAPISHLLSLLSSRYALGISRILMPIVVLITSTPSFNFFSHLFLLRVYRFTTIEKKAQQRDMEWHIGIKPFNMSYSELQLATTTKQAGRRSGNSCLVYLTSIITPLL